MLLNCLSDLLHVCDVSHSKKTLHRMGSLEELEKILKMYSEQNFKNKKCFLLSPCGVLSKERSITVNPMRCFLWNGIKIRRGSLGKAKGGSVHPVMPCQLGPLMTDMVAARGFEAALWPWKHFPNTVSQLWISAKRWDVCLKESSHTHTCFCFWFLDATDHHREEYHQPGKRQGSGRHLPDL